MISNHSISPLSGSYFLYLLTKNSSYFLLTINLLVLVIALVTPLQHRFIAFCLLGLSSLVYGAALFCNHRQHLHLSRRFLALGYGLQVAAASVAWPSEHALPLFLLCGMLVCGFFYRTHEHRELTLCSLSYALGFIALAALPRSHETYMQEYLRLSLSLLMVAAVGWLVRQQLGFLGKGKRHWHPLSWQLLLHSRHSDRRERLSIDHATVLFADLQGYQKFNREQPDEIVVATLHSLYQQFDHCAAALHIEKIKTNGDQYMAVCAGTPANDSEGIVRVCLLATRLLDIVERFNNTARLPCRLRVGIASGPITAGYIGSSKRQFDVWGQTVNRAAMLEQQAPAGSAALCANSYAQLRTLPSLVAMPFLLHPVDSTYLLIPKPARDIDEATFAMDEPA